MHRDHFLYHELIKFYDQHFKKLRILLHEDLFHDKQRLNSTIEDLFEAKFQHISSEMLINPPLKKSDLSHFILLT
jgi:hypothetical protein